MPSANECVLTVFAIIDEAGAEVKSRIVMLMWLIYMVET
jgi:hypothetical protein